MPIRCLLVQQVFSDVQATIDGTLLKELHSLGVDVDALMKHYQEKYLVGVERNYKQELLVKGFGFQIELVQRDLKEMSRKLTKKHKGHCPVQAAAGQGQTGARLTEYEKSREKGKGSGSSQMKHASESDPRQPSVYRDQESSTPRHTDGPLSQQGKNHIKGVPGPSCKGLSTENGSLTPDEANHHSHQRGGQGNTLLDDNGVKESGDGMETVRSLAQNSTSNRELGETDEEMLSGTSFPTQRNEYDGMRTRGGVESTEHMCTSKQSGKGKGKGGGL